MNHYDLLLIGAGHAHLGVLRRWAMQERPPGRIGLLSPGPAAWYSGMLPGLLAGRYRASDCQVDLHPLCRAAKVELIIGEAEALHGIQHLLYLTDGRSLSADWLSLNVGGQVACPPQQGSAMQVLAVKPFADFIAEWQRWQLSPQRDSALAVKRSTRRLAIAWKLPAWGLAINSRGCPTEQATELASRSTRVPTWCRATRHLSRWACASATSR